MVKKRLRLRGKGVLRCKCQIGAVSEVPHMPDLGRVTGQKQPAPAYVARWLQSFKEFPPRQKPGSFNLDRAMEKLTAGPSGNQ